MFTIGAFYWHAMDDAIFSVIMPTQLKEIKAEQKMVEKAMHTVKVNGEQPSKNRDQIASTAMWHKTLNGQK